MPEPSRRLASQFHTLVSSPLLMLLVAFGLRLAAMNYMQSFEIPTDGDHYRFGGEMGRIARSIASGQGFSSPMHGPSGPTAWVPPVYPYLLAGIFNSFGIYTLDAAWVTLTLNSLFSALTCLPIFYIGRKSFGPQVAAWAGWGWAFFPYAVHWSIKWVWATSLATFLLSLVFLLALYLERCPAAKAWLGFGLLWGLVALTETALLSTLPFFMGWLCYGLRRQGMVLARAISAFTLAFVLVVTPWLIRNYLTFSHFVFIRSSFGLELHQGNHETATGAKAYWLYPAFNEDEMEKLRQMGELPYVAEKQREALHFILAQPGRFIWLILKRVVYFWTGWTGTQELIFIFWLSGRFVAAKFIFYTSISVLAFVGLCIAFRNREPEAPAFAILLMVFPVVYYVTHSSPRYRHPIEPAMVVLAAYALTNILSRPALRKGRWLALKSLRRRGVQHLPSTVLSGQRPGRVPYQ